MRNQTLASAIIVYLGTYNAQKRMYARKTAEDSYSSALLPLLNMYQPSLKPILGQLAENRQRKTSSKKMLRELNIDISTPLLDQPARNGEIKKVLLKGARVNIKGVLNNYYYVIADGKDGWIAKLVD